jgi:arsenate reductase (thioredoxin)
MGIKNRLHIGFDDPSHVTGTEEYIHSEFIRVREEIREGFHKLYKQQIEPELITANRI